MVPQQRVPAKEFSVPRIDHRVEAGRPRCPAMRFSENAIIWTRRAALLPNHERCRAANSGNEILRSSQADLGHFAAPDVPECRHRVPRVPPRLRVLSGSVPIPRQSPLALVPGTGNRVFRTATASRHGFRPCATNWNLPTIPRT